MQKRQRGASNSNWKGGVPQKTKRKIALSEHQEQSLYIEECFLRGKKDPRWLAIFAIPNEHGKAHISVAMRLNREGRRAGVPDLMLPVSSGPWHGLFLELKTARGCTSPKQKEWIKLLRDNGYCALVCKGYEAAIKATELYLAGRIIKLKTKLYEYEVAP